MKKRVGIIVRIGFLRDRRDSLEVRRSDRMRCALATHHIALEVDNSRFLQLELGNLIPVASFSVCDDP